MKSARLRAFGLLLTLCLSFGAHAQTLPRLAWEHTTAPRGDGTRAFLRGSQTISNPFPTQIAVNQPAFDDQAVVATADGAYLILPVNGGGGSENLAYLLPPYWLSNRGWQVLRVNAAGQVLWSRYIRNFWQPQAPVPLRASAFNGAPELLQTQLTQSGGIAVLSTSGLDVFDAQGISSYSTDLASQHCRLSIDDFASPTAQFLTDEDLLVLGFGLFSSTTEPRACAIDFNGLEVARLNSAQPVMEVGDFRRDFGFLVKEGTWSMGIWSNATLSLRSSSLTHWSKTGAEGHGVGRGKQISSNGETWLTLNGAFTKLGLNGNSAWQIPLDDLPERTPIAWLGANRLLLATDEQSSVRVLDGSGTTVWTRSLGAFTTPGSAANWQVGSSNLRIAGYRASTNQGRVLSLRLADGELLGDTLMNWTHERPHLGFGLSGSERSIDIAEGVSSFSWERPTTQPCDLSGYCPDLASYAKPEVRVYQASTGSLSATTSADSFGFPLSAYPLERRSRPRPIFSTVGEGVLSLQYVHDGIRNQARVERINQAGQVQWTRDLAFNFDAGNASLYDNGTDAFVSSAELGPLNRSTTASMWKLDRATGQTVWSVALPFALQPIRPLRLPLSPRNDVCGISVDAPYRLGCVSVDGVVTRQIPVSSPPDLVRLRAEGSTVINNSLHLRVRTLPTGSDASDRFEFGAVNQQGIYLPEFTLSFAAVEPGQRLRADAYDAATGTATAALYGNSTSSRPIAFIIAKFDATGTRLWQQRIDGPLRGLAPDTENSAVAQATNGDIYVSSHPYQNATTFGTRVCRLSSAGAVLGCFDSPREGRVVSLLSLGAKGGVWAWQRGLLGANTGPAGMFLYRVDANGFGPQRVAVSTHAAFAADSFTDDGEYGYFMLVSNGTGSDRAAADTRLVSIQLDELPLFADGFEEP